MEPSQKIKDRRVQQRAYYARNRRNGVCVDCGQKPADNGVRCVECRAVKTASNRRYRARLRKEGRCSCGHPIVSYTWHCDVCVEKIRHRMRDYYARKRKEREEDVGGSYGADEMR